MMNTLHALYVGTPARWDCGADMATAVQRLAQASLRRQPTGLRHEAMVGTVAADEVALQRFRPGVRNALSPVFTGHFRSAAAGTVLEGRFAPHALVQCFVTAWFGLLGAMLWLALTIVTEAGVAAWWAPVACAAMGLVGWGFVTLSLRIGAPDIAWLSAQMQRALQAPALADTAGAQASPPDARVRP